MSEECHINDVRKPEEYRGVSFSGYKKTAAIKQLVIALRDNRIEPACYWTAELVCAGHFVDLWETIIQCAAKHIHVANPLLFPYLELRLGTFRDVVKNGFVGYELHMRNNAKIRRLFTEVVCVLCQSRKNHTIEHIKIKKDEFDITEMSNRLKAPTMEYGARIYQDGDPKELFVPINECAYHVSKETKNSMMACYWVEWIIEFDSTCRKKKEICQGNRRILTEMPDKSQKDVIWIVWDLLIKEAERSHKPVVVKIVKSLVSLFAMRYSAGVKKKRRYLLYLAVSLLTTPVNTGIKIYENKAAIDSVVERVDAVYRQVKKNEKAPATEYLTHGLDSQSSLEKTVKKLDTINSLGLLGTRK